MEQRKKSNTSVEQHDGQHGEQHGAAASAAQDKPKPRTIHMPNLPRPLSLEEKRYLLAVERGDIAAVRRIIQRAERTKSLNVNCVDPLGRGALSLAIDNEQLDMVQLLVVMGVATGDALLIAIDAGFVEVVELLLEHEELVHKEGEPYSWEKVDWNVAMFTPDITPLILAAHRNNYEILKILLDRGATLPMPHDVKCGCDTCLREQREDSLQHSAARLSEYRALSSPSLMALSSADPLLTTFQLSWELRELATAEPESRADYLELRKSCQQFAVDLLQQIRSSTELAVILNHDPNSPPYEDGEHMKLARLELAILYKQKKFVAHPKVQQLLAALWYEGLPGFRRKSMVGKAQDLAVIALLFPLYCTVYMVAPDSRLGRHVRKPFIKFLLHASSYLFFLLVLILVSQRIDVKIMAFFHGEDVMERQRGNAPTPLEWVVAVYVLGFIWEETAEMLREGMRRYLRNLWNFIDFSRNLLYVLCFVFRAAAFVQQRREVAADPQSAFVPRERWSEFDPQLVGDGVFAAANILSALKLVHLFSINPHLGPLQISLGRMVNDIVKFLFIYSLVLFAFACGMNQLLWYFAELERRRCFSLPDGRANWEEHADSCTKWRSFANLFEASQSLFWASFGNVGIDSFELTGIKQYTRFWGLLMFGSYSVINVIVLLNLLIAMMSNSYAMIEERSDTEWKFARTRLWMSYFEQGATLPPPFNIFPTPKRIMRLLRPKSGLRRMSTKRKERVERERDYRYSAVMRALVWRHVSKSHRACIEAPVTEDDVNEVKGDISALRCDLLEVMSRNGFDVSAVRAADDRNAPGNKRQRVWERRLLKDFHVAPVATVDEEEQLIMAPPPENETGLQRFRRVAKLAVLQASTMRWRQVVQGLCQASQIGRCHNRESFMNQQSLQRAMEEARRLAEETGAVGLNAPSGGSSPMPPLPGTRDFRELLRGEPRPQRRDSGDCRAGGDRGDAGTSTADYGPGPALQRLSVRRRSLSKSTKRRAPATPRVESVDGDLEHAHPHSADSRGTEVGAKEVPDGLHGAFHDVTAVKAEASPTPGDSATSSRGSTPSPPPPPPPLPPQHYDLPPALASSPPPHFEEPEFLSHPILRRRDASPDLFAEAGLRGWAASSPVPDVPDVPDVDAARQSGSLTRRTPIFTPSTSPSTELLQVPQVDGRSTPPALAAIEKKTKYQHRAGAWL
ncbi:transient-receptor-potential-like protein [Thrips palmi]|uniref:Transient-receptor-potential-like protein n=1 Tax=Thrips palmi TaxID=161013 RepID=A0A6P9A034_THRPL|nr:transient-receptor-potential-like protein [Thrips palmi]